MVPRLTHCVVVADGLVVVLHAAIYLGASVVVFPKFDFVPLLDSIISLNISSLYLVPPMIVLLTKHPAVGENGREEKLKGVMKDIMVGAAPLTEELVTVFRKRFPHTDIGQGCTCPCFRPFPSQPLTKVQTA